MSSGHVVESLLEYIETSYVYAFDEDVQYCQILTVNVMAISAAGQSVPASVSKGFPIGEILLIKYLVILQYSLLLRHNPRAARQPFQSDVTVIVTFSNDRIPMAKINFMVCKINTDNNIIEIVRPVLYIMHAGSAYL